MMHRFVSTTAAGHGPTLRPLPLMTRAVPGQNARVWGMLRDGFIALVITALFTVIANAAPL